MRTVVPVALTRWAKAKVRPYSPTPQVMSGWTPSEAHYEPRAAVSRFASAIPLSGAVKARLWLAFSLVRNTRRDSRSYWRELG